MIQGRAPLGIRLWTCFQSFWVVTLLVFGALTVIFMADYFMEFNARRDVFFWRVGSFAGLSVFFALILTAIQSVRTHRWRIEDQALHLEHWGELSGAHRAVTLRVYTRDDGDAELKAILDNGGDAILAQGSSQDMLKLCHYLQEALRGRRIKARKRKTSRR